MLVPATMLVLLTLGAIALDLTALHGAHRSVHRVVSAAADDAAGMLDTRRIQQTGEVRIDADAAKRVASAHLASARLPGELVGPVMVEVDPAGVRVRVTVTVRVTHIMLRRVPGVGEAEVLTVSVTGRLSS